MVGPAWSQFATSEWPEAIVFLNDPTWPMQHIEADAVFTRCGIDTHTSGFASLPSRNLIGKKPVCAECLRPLFSGRDFVDAYLIAAAPDLLAALKGLTSYAYAISNPSLLPHDYEAAVRAIHKAEGHTDA